jgi:dolichol-phosphate mannosyltransferase
MKLSIIIPVYNEEKTVVTLLKKIIRLNIHDVEKEVIVVDDGSTDSSPLVISKLSGFKFFRHKRNIGKGAAVRTGLRHASGEYIIIQDADLEYDPHDIAKLIVPIKEKKVEVVYGTRLKRLPNLSRDERTLRFLLHYFGNRGLSLLTSILYGKWITDMESCYKLFPKKALSNAVIHARGFEFEPEITAKLLKKGYSVAEVSISTNPRGYEEGKKLNTVRDGVIALWTLLKYRFVD